MRQDASILQLSIDRSESSVDVDASLPNTLKAQGTRRRILLSGLDQFAERGYHATSIRDIAAQADLQSASLYRHFSSKEAILAELVLIAHEVLHEALVAALLTADADPRDQLRKLMAAHVSTHCRWWRLATVATKEAQHLSTEAMLPSATLKASAAGMARGILAEGLRRGDFAVPDEELTLVALASLGVAVAGWYPTQAHRMSPEQVGAVYADLSLSMVGAGA